MQPAVSCGAHGPLLLRACRNRVSGDAGNNVVQNQTSSTANMMTLNSHCTVQCVEAIKLRLVFLKQIEMYHTSVGLSFIGYTWERIAGGIARLLSKICFEHIAWLGQQLGGGKSQSTRQTCALLSSPFIRMTLFYLFYTNDIVCCSKAKL